MLRIAIMFVSVAEPLATIPQVFSIWVRHNTAGVSVTTWAAYSLASYIWLIYGLTIRDKPLIITSVLWVITETAVVAGLILY